MAQKYKPSKLIRFLWKIIILMFPTWYSSFRAIPIESNWTALRGATCKNGGTLSGQHCLGAHVSWPWKSDCDLAGLGELVPQNWCSVVRLSIFTVGGTIISCAKRGIGKWWVVVQTRRCTENYQLHGRIIGILFIACYRWSIISLLLLEITHRLIWLSTRVNHGEMCLWFLKQDDDYIDHYLPSTTTIPSWWRGEVVSLNVNFCSKFTDPAWKLWGLLL